MIALLEQHRQKIQQLCEKHHVRKLSVFGSAAREHDFHESSDVDFVVEFIDKTADDYVDDYMNLWDALESLLVRKVDLAQLTNIRNPYVKETILEDIIPFYRQAQLSL